MKYRYRVHREPQGYAKLLMRQSTLPPFRSGNLASCLPLRDLSYTDLEVFCFVPRLVGYRVRSLHRRSALCDQHGRLRCLAGISVYL